MNERAIEVRLSSSGFQSLFNRLEGPLRRQILARMGRELVSITKENFGVTGVSRPIQWAELSRAYQKRIKYFGPPKLIRSGVLMNSIRIGNVFNDKVTVETGDLPYASAHQFGNNRMPARPYFPVISMTRDSRDATLTPYAQARLLRAAEQEVARLSSL